MIGIVVAMDKNNLIGNNGDLPWLLPEDLKRFKAITEGSVVVMGRKTFKSIGKPLPNRINIVLTNNEEYKPDGCYTLHSVNAVLGFYNVIKEDNENMFIIGGTELFREFVPHVDEMFITEIHAEFEGDTYFPKINWYEWEIGDTEKGIKDEKNPYDYYFVNYRRNR